MTCRDEFGFSEWNRKWCDNCGHDGFPTASEAWHAALDAVRSKLAAKELWIAPMVADDEMCLVAHDAVQNQGHSLNEAYRNLFSAMRDSYIAYYGQDWESGLD